MIILLIIATLYLFVMLVYCLFKSIFILLIPRQFNRKKDIKGQKILITGAGSGLGRELSIEFSKHSVCLVLLDINRKSLVGTEKLLDPASKVFSYECDVSDRRKVYEVANKIREEVGDIDIVVNNAGVVNGMYLMDLPDEKIEKTMKVNALAHFWVTKAFLPAMMAKNKGHIVSIASLAGRSAAPKLTDYCASKFAAFGFAECLEMELRERKLDGIKVTIVCPSHIDTGFFDGAKLTLGSVLSPEYVAQEVLWAILKEKEIIYLPYILNLALIVQGLTPRWLRVRFYEISGNIKLMENFKGRFAEANGLTKHD